MPGQFFQTTPALNKVCHLLILKLHYLMDCLEECI